MPLAIEPVRSMFAADGACVIALAHANNLSDELVESIGISIVAYHVWWDPGLEKKSIRSQGGILGFHVCDWLVPTADLLLDRGMMGDGVIDLSKMCRLVEDAGYHGLIEVKNFPPKTGGNMTVTKC